MLEKQKQEVGDNSTAIQVNGDFVVTPYQEIRAIFNDLFQLNFPKVQEVAAQKAQERVDEMLEQLRTTMEKHKENIDKEKFTEPGVQYEMQSIAVDVARRGKKSNMDMLCELLCTVTSKDCPELIELIASEARRAIPMLSKKHLAYLSLEVLVTEASYKTTAQNLTLQQVENNLAVINQHIESANEISSGDLQYLNCVGCINHRGILVTGIVPKFMKEIEEIKDKNSEQLVTFCPENGLKNFETFLKTMQKCQVGAFSLSAIGRLIGWLNLGRYSQVDIKKLF